MPILSLQVTQTSVHEGLSCIGKIRKGAPKEVKHGRDGKEYTTVGQDLKFFRFTAEPEFAGAEKVFADLYGDEPTYFDPVYIIGDTVDDAFGYWLEEWKATALLHRCDGETQVLSYNPQAEMYVKARVPCEKLCDRVCGCKPVGRLSLLMPELMIELGVSGYVSVETHAVHDILSLQHALSAAVTMTGRITGVAFIFGRAPEKISARITDRDGKNPRRVNTTKSLFFLRPNQDYTVNNLLPGLKEAGNRALFGNNEPAPALQLPDGMTARDVLNNPKRGQRIGAPVVVKLEPVQPEPLETVEGEEVDEPSKSWTKEEADSWVRRKRAESFNNKQLLEALGVEKFGDHAGGIKEADDKFKAWLDKQLDGEKTPETEAV